MHSLCIQSLLGKTKRCVRTGKETLNYNDCSALLTQLKKEIEWLKEVDSTALQSTLKDLESSYKKFFKEKKGYPSSKARSTRSNPSGKYFVSVLCETEVQPLPQAEQTVGIDLGIKDFAILSTGEKVANPKYYRTYEKQLAKWQRIQSREIVDTAIKT